MKNDSKFFDVVEGIKEAETNVDKVLDAARLERHEGPSTRLTGEQKYNLLLGLLCVLAMFGFFAFIGITTILR